MAPMRTTSFGIHVPWVALALAGCVAGAETGDLGAAPDGAEHEALPYAPDGKADGQDVPAYAPLPEAARFDRPLDVLFAPDDPVITLEVEMIDRVRRARREDSATYDEGENPYRIRYAVYNLRNPSVAAALADAEDEGVDVQILIESEQLDPARDYNTTDEFLVSRGFELVLDHRQLTDAQRRTADLIGIVGQGLMHLKTRIYETPDSLAALSGSLNPGDEAVANEETLHLVTEERLIRRYERAFESVIAGLAIPNEWDEGAELNVLFTPASSGPRAATKVLDWIAEEREQILMMVFSLRGFSAPGHEGTIIDALARKVAEGVPVYVITDRKQSDGVDVNGNPLYANDRTEDRLRQAGVHVFEAINAATPYTAMHHKVGIFGRTDPRVITDAANWTVAGLGSRTKDAANYESVLYIDRGYDGGRVARRYIGQWMRVLSRYASQSESNGEPSYAEVLATLSQQGGWPAQATTFRAQAMTSWGQVVFVRGDHAALGAWGDAGPGVQLATDASSYPRWTTPAPVMLPLGAVFEWKLVIGKPGESNVRWESGSNRRGLAAPAPLVDDETSTLQATFRN